MKIKNFQSQVCVCAVSTNLACAKSCAEMGSNMHLSSYKKMTYMVSFYEQFFPKNGGKIKVLDVGSYDKGGTYRGIFADSRYSYTGLDIHEGPNVDLVPKAVYDWKEIKDESFDVVISGQTLEYIEYPWLTMKEIQRVLKPSGFCFIIVPSSVYYGALSDCYRYYGEGLSALAKWAGMKVHHASTGGIPETDHVIDWLSEWNDTCLAAQKSPCSDIKDEPFKKEIRVPIDDSNMYDMFKKRVKSACDRFLEKKPIVLFGAGWIGDTVLEILGNDNICFFVDNSSIKVGSQHKGKKVISLQEYKKDSERYNCLVTASEYASLAIKENLQIEGIECQMLFGNE